MVGVALSIVGGMFLAASGQVTLGFLFFCALIFFLLSLVFIRTRHSSIFVFMAVSLIAACRFMVVVPEVYAWENDHAGEEIAVVGRLTGFPEFHTYRSGQRGTWVFPLRIEAIQSSTVWEKQRGEIEIRITHSSSAPIVRYGQRVRLIGLLGKRTFPGRNLFELEVSSPEECRILSSVNWMSLVALGREWRDAAAVRLEVGLGKDLVDQEAVLKALVLGYRKEVPHETLDGFRRTGLLHIFAISGLHVGIVGLLLVVVLKTLGIPRDWFGVWLFPLLSIYVISTGMKSSALRALAMAGVFIMAPLFRRRPDIPTSVAFAAILLLLFQPLEILSPGFVFSFTVVIFIVMVYSAVPKTWAQGGWIRRYAVSLVITSMAASLASLPLAALYFGKFSPIALLGNLVVVPLTFCIVLSGWLSILVPVASAIFNHAAVVFINLLLGCVGWLDALPGSSWSVAPPPLLSIVLWYGSLIYLFTHAGHRSQRVYAVSFAGFAVLLALVC